jgi:hypothetical protein
LTVEETMGATDAAFAGSIPAIYEQYLGPLLFEPFAEDMAARLHDVAQGRLLETAAGTGISSPEPWSRRCRPVWRSS